MKRLMAAAVAAAAMQCVMAQNANVVSVNGVGYGSLDMALAAIQVQIAQGQTAAFDVKFLAGGTYDAPQGDVDVPPGKSVSLGAAEGVDAVVSNLQLTVDAGVSVAVEGLKFGGNSWIRFNEDSAVASTEPISVTVKNCTIDIDRKAYRGQFVDVSAEMIADAAKKKAATAIAYDIEATGNAFASRSSAADEDTRVFIFGANLKARTVKVSGNTIGSAEFPIHRYPIKFGDRAEGCTMEIAGNTVWGQTTPADAASAKSFEFVGLWGAGPLDAVVAGNEIHSMAYNSKGTALAKLEAGLNQSGVKLLFSGNAIAANFTDEPRAATIADLNFAAQLPKADYAGVGTRNAEGGLTSGTFKHEVAAEHLAKYRTVGQEGGYWKVSAVLPADAAAIDDGETGETLGVEAGAFKSVSGEPLRKVVAWANRQAWAHSGAALEAISSMAFAHSGADGAKTYAYTRSEEAFLLNCAESEVEAEKAAFRLAIGQGADGWSVKAAKSGYNGDVEVRTSGEADGEYRVGAAAEGRLFYRGYLVPPAGVAGTARQAE